MCGRTRCTLRADDFPRAYNRIVNNNNNNGDGDGTNNNTRYIHMDRYRPRFNASPGSYLPIVRTSSAQNNETPNQNLTVTVECMKWGLIPSFFNSSTPPDHYKMFNARSESISEKASFRRLIPNNRCLVMVEGFYEWKKDGSRKQPYYIHFKNGQPLVFAALYDSWKNSEGEIIHTFTILTTSSSSSFQWIHDRMPVILGSKSSIEAWLHEPHSSKYNTVLKPYEDSNLVWYPVTPAMGKPSFDGPECIVEILKDEKNLISKFFAKKGTGKEKDSSPREVSSEEKDQVDSYGSLKEEEETSELVIVSEDDNKNNITWSSLNLEETEKCGTKRDYSEFVASDLKPSTDSIKNEAISRKKGNLENADQKQPTLLSYFGRK